MRHLTGHGPYAVRPSRVDTRSFIRRATCLDYYDTYAAYRFSPLDVNSRESACLTNFLLSGKCVLLELGNLPNESTVNVSDYGDELSLNTSDTEVSGTSTLTSNSHSHNNSRLFSHMIISHNQELMIHAIAFGLNNPMSKIGGAYIVSDERDQLSMADLDESSDELDDDGLDKELRIDVIAVRSNGPTRCLSSCRVSSI
jgi:hypothetical protein